jgi:hypothetical protein
MIWYIPLKCPLSESYEDLASIAVFTEVSHAQTITREAAVKVSFRLADYSHQICWLFIFLITVKLPFRSHYERPDPGWMQALAQSEKLGQGREGAQ